MKRIHMFAVAFQWIRFTFHSWRAQRALKDLPTAAHKRAVWGKGKP